MPAVLVSVGFVIPQPFLWPLLDSPCESWSISEPGCKTSEYSRASRLQIMDFSRWTDHRHLPPLAPNVDSICRLCNSKDCCCFCGGQLAPVIQAEVAELADARGSGPRTRKGVGVRVPSSAPMTKLKNQIDAQGIVCRMGKFVTSGLASRHPPANP